MKRLFKVLAFVLVALVGLVALMGLVGAALPRTHVATSSAFFHQPVDSVWVVVADMEHSAAWRTDIKAVERLADRHGHPVWNQISDEGHWPLEIIESVPGTRLSSQVADESQGFGGTWTYIFATENGGTRLTITERGFVANPFFRFMARFIFGLHGTMDGYLKALGKHFGETVTPARVE